MKRNEWQARYGAARRATDKAACAELEKRIAREKQDQWNEDREEEIRREFVDDQERERIARAFGRPL